MNEENASPDSPSSQSEAPSPERLVQETAELAHAYFRERGEAPGFDLDDWLRAEQEVRRRHERAE